MKGHTHFKVARQLIDILAVIDSNFGAGSLRDAIENAKVLRQGPSVLSPSGPRKGLSYPS